MTVFDDIYQYDLRLLQWCVKSHRHAKTAVYVRALSRTGDGYLQIVLPIVIALLNSNVHFVFLAIKAFAAERVLYFCLKHSLRRRRPPDIVPNFSCLVEPSDKFSFPSGHTMAAFLLAGLVVNELGSAATPLYLWALGVGVSRVMLGVHFPTDILAGALISTLILLGVT